MPFGPSADSSGNCHALPRIGTGLGCRSKIWLRVYNRLYNTGDISADPLTTKEKLWLQQLAFPNITPLCKQYKDHPNTIWLTLIPTEYIEYYEMIYDEMKVLSISEREVIKIDKDVPRTYGLFARNSKQLHFTIPDITMQINIATELPPRSDQESDLRLTTIIREDLQQLLYQKPTGHIMTAYYISLKNILLAISYERGYCQGINFIVASMLLHFPYEREVYIMIAFMMKYRFVGILFDPKYSSLLDYIRIFEKKLRKHNRRIYRHFKKTEFTAVSYTIEWFTTCFIVSSPGELSLCVIDMILAGYDNIMLRIGLALLDCLEEPLLLLDFEGLHGQFKTLMMTVDPIAVMARALCIDIGTSNNLLRDMAVKIESIDPSANGNLKFSRLSTMKIHDRDPLDQSLNTSVDACNTSQLSLRSEEDEGHKYADDEAPHHPIANPDSSLLHPALLSQRLDMKKKPKSKKQRSDAKRSKQKRHSSKSTHSAGTGSTEISHTSTTAASSKSLSTKLLGTSSKKAADIHQPPSTPSTLKHIDNYSPLSPPPPAMTPNTASVSTEPVHEHHSGMWGSFVSGMSKILTPKTPQRSHHKDLPTNTFPTTPYAANNTNKTAPHSTAASSTPLRFPSLATPSTAHKAPYSAATQSLLFSPKYQNHNHTHIVSSTNKASSSTAIKQQGHVVVHRNLQTYSVHGSDASSGSMTDTSSGDSEEDQDFDDNNNNRDNGNNVRLFASPKRFANKRIMSFLYKHDFRRHHSRRHKKQRHSHHLRSIAGYCPYCGCVDLEEDYDGEYETNRSTPVMPHSSAVSNYIVQRNSVNVILFSEEGSTIECQTSRKNRLVIRSLQSTQEFTDQGGEVVPRDYYVYNRIIAHATIFESWFNSTGKRVSCGNRNIRKRSLAYTRGKGDESKDVFSKLTAVLQQSPNVLPSTSFGQDEEDSSS